MDTLEQQIDRYVRRRTLKRMLPWVLYTLLVVALTVCSVTLW